jgi:endonuclease-3
MTTRQGLQESLEQLPAPGPDPAPRDAFGQILWENIGYLIDDGRRRELFGEFAARIGVDAHVILLAPDADLLDIARRGGMRPEVRVGRWRQIAEITLGPGGGDLDRTLRSLPPGKARALLKLYPAIGDPGADKILLFAGISPRPSLDSNGVRVLARLGFAQEQKAYGATWRQAVAALAKEGLTEAGPLVQAYLTLRAHGQTTCKRSAPLCMACPLDAVCAHSPTFDL